MQPRALALPRHSFIPADTQNTEAPFWDSRSPQLARSKPPLGQMTVTLAPKRLSSPSRTASAFVLWRPLPKQFDSRDFESLTDLSRTVCRQGQRPDRRLDWAHFALVLRARFFFRVAPGRS